MIIHDIKQRTDEWFQLRAGKITASVAKKIVTPAGKPSTQYRKEIGRIIAERLELQPAEDVPQTEWIIRGRELESEALAWFQVETGLNLSTCGFIESDDHMSGFSPDAIIGDVDTDAGFTFPAPLEAKVPKPSTHIAWLMGGKIPDEHIGQVHFGMAITKTPYAYFMSYCPGVEPLIIRAERNDYTETMVAGIRGFVEELQETYKQITGKDYAND